ncbi:MAG: DUF2804 domain-containing protein [Treponema sp.]|jgi:hypothetical protein|nr:DUF2804 domain-containing protein [Treponema sp.]
MAQNEITSPVSVINGSGWPENAGWARSPLFFYDPALVWAPRRRIAESDRYVIYSPTHMVILEVLDDGYLGYMGVSVISLRDKKRVTQYFLRSFPLGGFELPPGSGTGAIRYRHKKTSLDFVPMDGGVRIIKMDIPRFGHHRILRGELVLTEPAAAESLVTNMPWRREKSAFRYSRRSPWYTVEGVIQFGTAELVFTRGNAWGIFDWNRGVRPRGDTRMWAAGCGLAGEHQIGFSVGYSSADASQGTENAFFLDGKLHKLDQVTFHISPANWQSPWRFTSNDNRLEMVFTPHQERVERNRLLFYSLKRRQLCGFFSGKVILDDGTEMEFQHITGFAERRKTRF